MTPESCLNDRGRGSSVASIDNESNIEEEIAQLRREIAAKGSSKQGEDISIPILGVKLLTLSLSLSALHDGHVNLISFGQKYHLNHLNRHLDWSILVGQAAARSCFSSAQARREGNFFTF